MGIDILGIDIMGVDILGIDIPAPTRLFFRMALVESSDKNICIALMQTTIIQISMLTSPV